MVFTSMELSDNEPDPWFWPFVFIACGTLAMIGFVRWLCEG